MKKKVCKKCKIIVDGNECPICKKNQFSNNWQGHLVVIDPVKSEIAKVMEYPIAGDYAIKVR